MEDNQPLLREIVLLQNFLSMTDDLRRHTLKQLLPRHLTEFEQAVDWMIREAESPLSEHTAAELKGLLSGIVRPFENVVGKGIIDGLSGAGARIVGMKWTEFAQENNIEITINEMENLQRMIRTVDRGSEQHENHEGK